jgi:acetyltransferase-like isoleucine patch superfamily enzyme
MALHQKFLRHNDILQSTAGGNAIVTADAAVNKDVQANTFVGGASAKFIKAIG